MPQESLAKQIQSTHEDVHDQIFQMAYAYHTDKGRSDLGDLIDDAKIYAALKETLATIPSGIRAAYLEQCHEIVAFDQQEKFMDELMDILKEPSSTEHNSLNSLVA